MERITAILWVLTAVAGLALRVRRLFILYSFHCTDLDDIAYHHSVIRSSWLRFVVKSIFLMGGTLAVWTNPNVPFFPADYLFWFWRGGILVALLLLLIEDMNVDRMRRLLGTLESGRWSKSS